MGSECDARPPSVQRLEKTTTRRYGMESGRYEHAYITCRLQALSRQVGTKRRRRRRLPICDYCACRYLIISSMQVPSTGKARGAPHCWLNAPRLARMRSLFVSLTLQSRSSTGNYKTADSTINASNCFFSAPIHKQLKLITNAWPNGNQLGVATDSCFVSVTY